MVDSSSYYLMVATFLPLIFSPVAYYLGKRMGVNVVTWISLIILALSTIFIIIPSLGLSSGGIYQETYSWSLLGHFGLKLDGLSIPFAITIYFVCTVVVLYSKPYMVRKILQQFDKGKDASNKDLDSIGEEYNGYFQNKDNYSTLLLTSNQKSYLNNQVGLYFSLYLAFSMGMVGAVLATNLVEFYVFFELMLVPAFFLIAFYGYGNRRKVSFVFLFWSAIGALILLLGLLAIGFFTGSFDYNVIKANIDKIPINWINLIIFSILIGFGIKLGLLFLHVWLPDTYTLSATPISVLISSVMTGIGAYGIIRIWLDLLSIHYSGYGIYLQIWAVSTMVFGGAMALMQSDVKRILAYSSISSMGYILFGIGSESVLGISGAILLFVTHGLGKALLFMTSGNLILQAGSQDLNKLGGLSGRMPYTAVLAMIGGLTIMGVPITSGFMAEWVLFNGSLQGAVVNHMDSLKVILFAIAMLTTALTSAYILWLYKRVFFGTIPETLKNVKDARGYVIITMGILAAFTLIIGVYPDLFYKSIVSYVESVYAHINGVVPIKQKTVSTIKNPQPVQFDSNKLSANKTSKVGLIHLNNNLSFHATF